MILCPFTDFRLWQPQNAVIKVDHISMLHSSGTIIVSNCLQFSNANAPILITLLGMLMEVRLRQYSKAPPLILVTPSGMLMEVRLLQVLKALRPILVTLYCFLLIVTNSGITISPETFLFSLTSTSVGDMIVYLIPSTFFVWHIPIKVIRNNTLDKINRFILVH